MARPKSYDRREAVEKACRAFWAHGYQALGVRELERLTGLNQFAIRSEFGGKESLYLEALDFYSNAAISHVLMPLAEGGIAEIAGFFEGLVTEGSMTSSRWGCLIVNTGIENARIGSEKLEAATRYYWNALERAFLQALENARDRGEIRADVESARVAKGLVTAVMGVHARNRSVDACDGGADLVGLIGAYLNSLRPA